MNREIKFRAWAPAEKILGMVSLVVWSNADDYKKPHRFKIEYPDRVGSFYETGNAILQQWTGLHDKNGKEIYEGDIVEYEHQWRILTWKEWDEGKRWSDIPEEWEKRRSAVNFDGGGFTLEYPLLFQKLNGVGGPVDNRKMGYLSDFKRKDEHGNGDSIEEWRNFEVIGNIYENPELLQGAPAPQTK